MMCESAISTTSLTRFPMTLSYFYIGYILSLELSSHLLDFNCMELLTPTKPPSALYRKTLERLKVILRSRPVTHLRSKIECVIPWCYSLPPSFIEIGLAGFCATQQINKPHRKHNLIGVSTNWFYFLLLHTSRTVYSGSNGSLMVSHTVFHLQTPTVFVTL